MARIHPQRRQRSIDHIHWKKKDHLAVSIKDNLKNNIEIIDLKDENGKSSGTEVLLHIPYSLMESIDKSKI